MNDITQLHLHVGQEVGVSPWFQVDQERIDQFASAIVDPQWIHIDPERARRESPYGGTIAHGFLTLSLLSHLLESTVDVSRMKMGVNYGLNRVRFTDAVPPARASARASCSANSKTSGAGTSSPGA